jgi:hypothetical protein
VDPARLIAEGFAETPSGGRWVYAAPDATVLLSDAFLDTHCFRLERGDDGGAGLLGLAFEPLAGRRMVEVSGTLWMDPASGRLRELEYRYVNLPGELRDGLVGGELFFAGMPNGTWIVKEWRIRMPRGSIEQDPFGRRRAVVFGYEEEGGVVRQAATDRGEIAFDAAGGGVRGVVYDSAGAPARGVWVAVDGTDFTALTDAGGAFDFPELGRGVWTLTTTTPELEVVGRTVSGEVDVAAGEVRDVRLDLPSVRSSALARCWAEPPGPDEAVLVGRVVDEQGAPVLRALVSAHWSDFSFRFDRPRSQALLQMQEGFRERQEGFGLLTGLDGLFTFCSVPNYHTVRVRVSDGVREGSADVWIDRDVDLAVARVVIGAAEGGAGARER